MTPILIASLLLASAAQDDPFCDPLKQVVAAATGDYHVLEGELGEDGAMRARVTPEIEGGWDWCNVKAPDRMTGYYSCFANFDNQAPKDADVAALADAAAACFGPDVHATAIYRGPKGFGYPAERRIHVAGLQIMLMSMRTDYGVSGEHRPRPYLAAKPAHYYELVLDIRPD